MSARLIYPLLSCLLHAALFYVITIPPWPTKAKVDSVPLKLGIILVQPKGGANVVETEAKPMSPPPSGEVSKAKSEKNLPHPEKVTAPKRTFPPREKPTPVPIQPQPPAPAKIISKKELRVQKQPQSKAIHQNQGIASIGTQVTSPNVGAKTTAGNAPKGDNSDLITPHIAEADIVQIGQSYKQDLLQAIAQHKRYPSSARRRGLEGKVKIKFSLLQSGKITQISTAESSGWRSLDQAAIKSLKNLKRFKPIPQELKRDNWELVVTIRFSLE